MCLQDRLPLAWQPLEEARLEELRPVLDSHNQSVLQAILFLEHQHRDVAEDDPGLGQDLHRLEAKLDLILQLLAESMSGAGQLPARVPVRIEAGEIRWACSGTEPRGLVLVEVYPSARFPRPLRLAVRLDDGPAGVARGHFLGLEEAAQDALQRLLFLVHRRAVARARRDRGGASEI